MSYDYNEKLDELRKMLDENSNIVDRCDDIYNLPIPTQEKIALLMDEYIFNETKFQRKEFGLAGARARKALLLISKLATVRRKEIQERKHQIGLSR